MRENDKIIKLANNCILLLNTLNLMTFGLCRKRFEYQKEIVKKLISELPKYESN